MTLYKENTIIITTTTKKTSNLRKSFDIDIRTIAIVANTTTTTIVVVPVQFQDRGNYTPQV